MSGEREQKLIFLDIDGTLVVPVNSVPWSAKRACHKARKAGNLLFIASGRTRRQIPESILKIGFDGVVSSSGALVEYKGAILRSVSFEEGDLRVITDFLDGREIAYAYECEDGLVPGPYFIPFRKKLSEGDKSAAAIATLLREYLEPFFKSPPSGIPPQGVHKVIFITRKEDSAFAGFKNQYDNDYEIFANSIPGLSGAEISPKGVHKGAAITMLAEHLGIARENVFAFGDGDNDTTMLKAAGFGIAMGNATEGLKSVASYVTDRIERGGLAKAFKKFNLM